MRTKLAQGALSLLLGCTALSPLAVAQPVVKICIPVTTTVNGAKTSSCQDVDSTNVFPTSAGGGGGSGTSSNFGSAFPTAGTAIGLSDGTNMRTLTGINYSGSSYAAATEVFGSLPAGTNLMGKVGIDQTTPGTTNGVQVNAALPAGTNLLGKVGIDQTTPGTTNLVSESNFPSAVSTGTGAAGASSPRVTVATDSATVAGSASLPAGTNLIGKTGIDQTTPGTTNAVAATNFPSAVSTGTGAQGASSPRVTVATDSATVAGSASIPAGTNLMGKVGIDQTTPGTTNLVQESNFPSAVSTGTGAQGASSPRFTVATDSATVAGSATLPAGTNLVGKVGIDQTTGGSTNAVSITTTTSANVAGTSYASGAAESNHVVKASAGNLYSLYVFSTAAGLLMSFNSTTVPGDGAVTPIECIPVSANGTGSVNYMPMADNYATGISIAFSTGTNCFSKTASATAFFKVSYK